MEIWFHQAQICLIAFSSSNCILFYLVCILFYSILSVFYSILFYSILLEQSAKVARKFDFTKLLVPWICCLKAFPSSNCIVLYSILSCLYCIVLYSILFVFYSTWARDKKKRKAAKEKVEYNTRDSNVVPHRSTNRARTCLTSLSRREAVLSCWYGRTHALE